VVDQDPEWILKIVALGVVHRDSGFDCMRVLSIIFPAAELVYSFSALLVALE
jgi:hypothetical protein